MAKPTKAEIAAAARERRLQPIMDFSRVDADGATTRVQVFILHPGDVFPRFGGSSRGLLVNTSPSLITREISPWGQTDVEYDTFDHEAWARILAAYAMRTSRNPPPGA